MGLECLAKLHNQLVARVVPIGIVDELEVVDVDNQQAVHPALRQGLEQLALARLKAAPVVHLRQMVKAGFGFNLFLLANG